MKIEIERTLHFIGGRIVPMFHTSDGLCIGSPVATSAFDLADVRERRRKTEEFYRGKLVHRNRYSQHTADLPRG